LSIPSEPTPVRTSLKRSRSASPGPSLAFPQRSTSYLPTFVVPEPQSPRPSVSERGVRPIIKTPFRSRAIPKPQAKAMPAISQIPYKRKTPSPSTRISKKKSPSPTGFEMKDIPRPARSPSRSRRRETSPDMKQFRFSNLGQPVGPPPTEGVQGFRR
jgi:hypothetical protein